jgi:hypothetical protein
VSYSIAEESDFTDFNTAWTQWAVDMKAYINSLDTALPGDDMEALLVPAIPAIGAIALWLAKGAASYLLAKIVTTIIDIGLAWGKRKLEKGEIMSLETILKTAVLRYDTVDEEYKSRLGDLQDLIESIDTVLDIPGLRIWLSSAYAQELP